MKKLLIAITLALICTILLSGIALADDQVWGTNSPCTREWPERLPYELRQDASDNRFVVYAYIPIPVKFPEPAKTIPNIIQYDAPPGLDSVQITRWAQALPSARSRLAALYGIPQEVAIQYGAKYYE